MINGIVDRLSAVIILFEEEGKVQFFNKSAREIFSITKGDDIRSILKENDRDVFFWNVVKMAKRGEEYSNFMRFIDKDGNIIFCWLHVFGYGEYIAFEIFNLDRIKRSVNSLSDSDYIKILRYMSEGISHSIRNPIMSAGGMLSRLKSKISQLSDDRKLIQYVEIVEKSLNRIINIIANLEVVSSSLPAKLEKVYLGEIALKLKESYSDRVEFSVEEKEKVEVYMNRMHLTFIFEEIIKNALDAIESVDDPEIVISISKEGKSAVVSIKDNGRGMDEDEIPLVTVPFYSTKPSNMGIGLSLVKFLVESYLGRVEISSKKGEGTKVTIILPIEKRADIRIKELSD